VQEPVEQLLRSLPAARAGLVEIAALGGRTLDFDLECPLMSLPAVFGTTLETVPWPGPYLGAPFEALEERRLEFPSVRNDEFSLRVGLAWAGNPRYKSDRQRSMQLATLLPLLRTRGVTFISLQKGPAVEQLAALPGNVFLWDGSSRDRDLAETAALLAGLDLVIATDSCIAHLAGAMGKPVWILLPHLADWRWMEKTETTPWYPTAQLLRQSRAGDWAGVVERVIGELSEMRAMRSGQAANLVQEAIQPQGHIQP
jgi:hypothetical protein